MLTHCGCEMVSNGVNSGPLPQDKGSFFEIIPIAMSLEVHIGSTVLIVDLVADTRPWAASKKSLSRFLIRLGYAFIITNDCERWVSSIQQRVYSQISEDVW